MTRLDSKRVVDVFRQLIEEGLSQVDASVLEVCEYSLQSAVFCARMTMRICYREYIEYKPEVVKSLEVPPQYDRVRSIVNAWKVVHGRSGQRQQKTGEP
jgi:hypothetical protein